MRVLTIGYGAALTALGVGGYLASGRASKTALIPVAFGLPVMALGAVAFVPGLRWPAMAGARAIAGAAMAGTARGLTQIPDLIEGRAERPMAVIAQCAMAGLSLGYSVIARRG